MSETQIKTGKVRASYANVFEPRAMEEGQEPKYSISLLVGKDDKFTVDRIKKGILAALVLKVSIFPPKVQEIIKKGKIPNSTKFWNPLRDGDEEKPDNEEYEGKFYVNAKNKRKPGIVGKDLQELYDETEFYSGCYCRAVITFFAFNTSGNMGAGVSLELLQKLDDGEPLGGSRISAEVAFGDDEDDLLDDDLSGDDLSY